MFVNVSYSVSSSLDGGVLQETLKLSPYTVTLF
jgi:hypothetical protein